MSAIEFSDEDLGMENKRIKLSRDKRIEAFHKILERFPNLQECLENYQICNFLKARRFDIKKTIKMLKEYLKFRDRIGWDQPLTKHWELAKSAKTSGFIRLSGFDKEGRVILIVRWNYFLYPYPGKKWKPWTNDEQSHFDIFILTKFIYPLSALVGHTKAVWIHDMGERGLMELIVWPTARNFWQEMQHRLSINLPETIHQHYLINIDAMTMPLFNMAKAFMTEESIAKYRFLKSNEEIYEYIAKEMVEEEYGGGHAPYPETGSVDVLWYLEDWNQATGADVEKMKEIFDSVEEKTNARELRKRIKQ
jgi:hypothetical protein